MKTIAAKMMIRMVAKKWVKIRRKKMMMMEMKRWRILQKKISKGQKKTARKMTIRREKKRKIIHASPFTSRARSMI